MEISRIGVVGAGQMGNGIAHVLSLAGYEVLLTDVSPEAIERRWPRSAPTWTGR
jgi:3-hydroxybutyryl-CoA dehydrogenase